MLPCYDVLEQKNRYNSFFCAHIIIPSFFHLISNKQGINAVNF